MVEDNQVNDSRMRMRKMGKGGKEEEIKINIKKRHTV